MAEDRLHIVAEDQIAACLARLEEAEAILVESRRAEVAIAEARRALSGLVGREPTAPSLAEETSAPPDSQPPRQVSGGPGLQQLLVDQVFFGSKEEGSAWSRRRPGDEDSSPLSRDDSSPLCRADTQDFSGFRLGVERTSYGGGLGEPHAAPLRCSMPILRPHSNFRNAWNTLGFLAILYEILAIPYDIAFNPPPAGFFSIVTVVNLYFIADVFVNFITGYKSNMGVLVMVPGRIAKQYARTWLLPDVAASIPWEWIPIENRWPRVVKMVRLVRISRVLRLLRLLRVSVLSDRAQQFIEESPSFLFAFAVLRLLFLVFCCTHWAGCIWFIVGHLDFLAEDKSWVMQFVPSDSTDFTKYIHSLYFSLTTMTTVGYGDITPQNTTEKGFAIFLLLIASIVFASIMGALVDIIGSLNNEKHQTNEKMQHLTQYMYWRHVPPSLFQAIRKHLLFVWDTNKGYDEYEQSMMVELSPVLRKELAYHVYGRVLRSAPFFAWMQDNEVCLKELALLVSHSIFARGDVLFRAGQVNVEIHVVLSGSVRLSLNEKLHHLHGHEESASDEEIQDTHATRLGMKLPNDMVGVSETVAHHHHNVEKNVLTAVGTMQMLMRKSNAAKKSLASTAGTPFGKRRTLDWSSFRASILQRAATNHTQNISDSRDAALQLQRSWRTKKMLKEEQEAESEQQRHHRRHHHHCPHHVASKSVKAPVYLGESCLWVPFESWDDDEDGHVARFRYNATCESRVEIVLIRREAVKDIIDRFSPWLANNFEAFRISVIRDLQESRDVALNGEAFKPCEEESDDESEYEVEDSEEVTEGERDCSRRSMDLCRVAPEPQRVTMWRATNAPVEPSGMPGGRECSDTPSTARSYAGVTPSVAQFGRPDLRGRGLMEPLLGGTA